MTLRYYQITVWLSDIVLVYNKRYERRWMAREEARQQWPEATLIQVQ